MATYSVNDAAITPLDLDSSGISIAECECHGSEVLWRCHGEDDVIGISLSLLREGQDVVSITDQDGIFVEKYGIAELTLPNCK